MEIFLHKKEVPKNCLVCPLRRTIGHDESLFLYCCITNVLVIPGSEENVTNKRHESCPIKILEEHTKTDNYDLTVKYADAQNKLERTLQELNDRAMRNDYSVVYIEDILELAKKYNVKVK